MNPNRTESELILGLQRGDREAWISICDQYGRRVWRYVARLVGPDEEAVAEIYQESMLGVIRASQRLEASPQRLWPWLTGIAHRQVALYWRKHYQRPAAATMGSEADSNCPTPEESMSRKETVCFVRARMSEMSNDYVALLFAKYVDELSVNEIVELMGGTKEAVRSKLARARREFRRKFGTNDLLETLR